MVQECHAETPLVLCSFPWYVVRGWGDTEAEREEVRRHEDGMVGSTKRTWKERERSEWETCREGERGGER